MQNHSFVLTERKSTCFEDEETELFIEVDCFNVESVLSPAPEGLSQQQVLDQSASISIVFALLLTCCLCRCDSSLYRRAARLNPLSPFPPKLVRRCILGSILESEKNYLEALKRILEVSACSRASVHFEL